MSDVEAACQDYCDEVALCVTVTPTRFVYPKGNEPEAVVGLIAYPRFPQSDGEIDAIAVDLARALMRRCGQNRVTVTTPDHSMMLCKEDDDDKENQDQ